MRRSPRLVRLLNTPTIRDIRTAAASRRTKRQRNRRLLLTAAGLVVVLGLLTAFVLPGVLRSQIEQRGTAFLGRPVKVDRVSLNPFTLTVVIEGLDIKDRDGEDLLGWQRLMVNANLWATLAGSWGADAIELDGMRGRLFMTATGELNIADIIEKLSSETGEPKSEPRLLELTRLEVTDAQVSLTDSSRSRPFASTIGPLSFSISDLHTKSDSEAPYNFAASTESGETINWRGTLSMEPLKSTGDFELSGINVPKYKAYFTDLIPLEIESGWVSASGSYELDWTEELPEVRLINGAAAVTGIVLSARDAGAGQHTLAKIEVQGIEAEFPTGKLAITAIILEDGTVDLQRSVAGIGLSGLPLGGAEAEGIAPAKPATNLPDVTVGAVRMERVRVRLQDKTLAETAVIGINLDSVLVENIKAADLSAPISLRLQASFPLGGALDVSGEASLQPLAPELAIKLSGLSLLAGADHLRALTGMELVRGTLDAAGRISVGETGLGFRGEMKLSDLAVLDASGEALAGLTELGLSGLDLRVDPAALSVATVTLVSPEAHVRIAADGRINLAGIGPQQSVEISPETIPAANAVLPELEVGVITFSGGRVSIRDDSIERAATVSLDDLSGVMAGWSSQDAGRGKVEMTGKVNGVSAMTIKGDLNPFGRPARADLAIAIDRMDLLPTRGYVSKYAGYELEGGRLSLDIAFLLRERAIESDTMTVLSAFTLGAQTASPDATKLPVKLGVALLKDSAGDIVIDVPVAGNLDDPEFRIGRVVWRVIANLLTKAATSPFAFLGSVVGGGAEGDLAHHAFAPGQTAVSDATRANLDQLIAALNDRPTLGVGIRGEYHPTVDAAALRPNVLENQLRSEAAATAFDATGAWEPFAREAGMVARYQVVFGVLPVDPDGELPVAETAESEPTPAAPPATAADGQTLLAWLRQVFGGDASARAEAGPNEAAPFAPSFPRPERLAPELPVLPMEEIESRLLEAIEVPEAVLIKLAEGRAEVARDYLLSAGLAESRIGLTDVAAGEAQVTLDLR